MSFRYAFQKVLEFKDHEKNEAERAYTDSVKTFEDTATRLYELLKRKEELMAENEKKLAAGLSISMIQLNEETISFLQKEIDRLQLATQKARRNMQDKEKYLLYKSVDFKKYEKMKEIKRDRYDEEAKRQEMRFLDEVSVQQFVRR